MEKRKHPRLVRSLLVKIIADHASFTSMSSDLSEKGLFIRTNRGFAVDIPIDIQLLLPGNMVSFLKGIVRRTIRTPISSMKNGIGIEIIEKDEPFLNFVKSMIGEKNENSIERHAISENTIVPFSNVEAENKGLKDNIKERRQHHRYKIKDREINVKMDLANEVKVIDISINGISLKTDRRLDCGKQYELKFDNRDNIFTVYGTVVWSLLSESKNVSDGQIIPIYTGGLQLSHVSDENLEELVNIIDGYNSTDIYLFNIYQQNDLIDLPECPDEKLRDYGKMNCQTTDSSQDIRKKSISEKRRIALTCSMEERSILLNNANKEVMLAMLENPKITEMEIERIANLHTIPEEIIKKIVKKRDWMKNYRILSALVNNPKTPPYIAVDLVKKLKKKDLKILKRNKNVPEAVRSIAEKCLCLTI